MAQKRFINYKDQIKSFDLVEKNIGIFKPGKYSGFDTISSVRSEEFNNKNRAY